MVSSNFTIAFATTSDIPDIFEFLLSDVLYNLSLNVAVGMTREDVYDRYLAGTKAFVANGTCVIVRSDDGGVIAIRLSRFEDRDQEPARENISSLSPRALKTHAIIEKINEGKWDLIPSDISRLFEIKLIYVAEKWRRQGIAQTLLNFGLDEARERGAQGAFAEAVATASQVLCARSGYSVIREIFHCDWLGEDGKPVFVCPDGTKSVQLVFTRL